MYDQLEEPEEEEDDMLDLAFGLTPTCVPLEMCRLTPFCAYTGAVEFIVNTIFLGDSVDVSA